MMINRVARRLEDARQLAPASSRRRYGKGGGMPLAHDDAAATSTKANVGPGKVGLFGTASP
nr:hypothetical protein [Variovorax paradoxus]